MTDEQAGDQEPSSGPGPGRPSADPEPAEAPTQLSVLPTPMPEATGIPDVDAALQRLAELSSHADPAEHVAVFEDVHGRLQHALDGPDPD